MTLKFSVTLTAHENNKTIQKVTIERPVESHQEMEELWNKCLQENIINVHKKTIDEWYNENIKS